MNGSDSTSDLVVVGAGAAGLATAIFCARAARGSRIVLVDGATRIGAKILVSGGGRCNVTNRSVTERDFWGGPARIVRNVLRAFPAERTVSFFAELGVPLHEEERGKLFPDSNHARSVLDALLAEATRLGVELRTGCRIVAVAREGGTFALATGGEPLLATAVVLATGGRSLPKTGSDGGGYALAAALGHGHIATTPALVPLLLDDRHHAALSGVAYPAVLTVRVDGRVTARLEGPLLWTHVGASGPVVLDASRHWHRAVLNGQAVEVVLNSCPGETFTSMEEWLLTARLQRSTASVGGVLASRLPAAVGAAFVAAAGVEADTTMAHLDRDHRRALVRVLVEQPLQVRDSRGYNYAEATAGGVPLDEVDAGTMESRRCPGLYLVGEILDVDGRLGGFNFQWAWSSAFVAGGAIGRRLRGEAL